MTRRRLHHVSSSRSDEVLLRSMLGLLSGQTTDDWQLVDDGDRVDLLLARACGEQDDIASATGLRADLRAVIGPGGGPGDLELAYPIRPRALAAMLDEASIILGRPKVSTTNAPVANLPTASASVSDPTLADLLYDLARHPSTAPESAVCSVDDGELMRIDTRHGRVNTANAAHVIDSAGRRGARLIPRADHVDASPDDQPLAPLLWSIGLAYPDALVEPVKPADLIVIKRWPDFGRLPHRGEHVRMTARLARQPISTEQLASQVDLPLPTAIGFVNAMLLGGLATSTASTIDSRNPPAPPHRVPAIAPRGDLLSRIRARLGL